MVPLQESPARRGGSAAASARAAEAVSATAAAGTGGRRQGKDTDCQGELKRTTNETFYYQKTLFTLIVDQDLGERVGFKT